MEMKVASLNINGGRSCVRRLQVFQLFENGKIDVLMLQETHANRSSEAEWRRIFKGCHLFSSALEEAKAGVAVVLHPRLQPFRDCL